MKNWRTTVIGIVLAIATAIQPYTTNGTFEWKQMILPALIALLGILANDPNNNK